MDSAGRLWNLVWISSVFVNGVPPQVCFESFRWDDCGMAPKPVMYYWKPGSRCEVGVWRGCLPNPNMFPDEFSCINTCIYVERHANLDQNIIDQDIITEFQDIITEKTEFGNVTRYDVMTTVADNVTEVNVTLTGNVTEASPSNITTSDGDTANNTATNVFTTSGNKIEITTETKVE